MASSEIEYGQPEEKGSWLNGLTEVQLRWLGGFAAAGALAATAFMVSTWPGNTIAQPDHSVEHTIPPVPAQPPILR